MGNGKSNGVLARLDNLEGWLKRIDKAFYEFMRTKECQRHDTIVGEAVKKADKAVEVAEGAEKTTKKILLAIIAGTISLLIGMAVLFAQNVLRGAGP